MQHRHAARVRFILRTGDYGVENALLQCDERLLAGLRRRHFVTVLADGLRNCERYLWTRRSSRRLAAPILRGPSRGVLANRG
jgi:hypothetical protein